MKSPKCRTVIDNECLPETDPVGPTTACAAPVLMVEIGTSLAEIERMVTLATLAHYRRHKERTGAALGVSLKTLYNRLKEYATVPVDSSIDGTSSSDFGGLT